MQLPSDILPVEWAHCSPFGMFCAECKVPLSLDYKLMKRHAERNHEDGNKYSYEELKTTIMLANSIIDHLKDENVRPYLVGEPKTACQCSICNAIVLDSKNFARHKKSKSGCSEGKIMHITVQDTTCFRTIPVEDVAGVPRGAEIPFERTKDWLLPIMPEEEEVQPYVAYMHHFTLLGDAQSVIKGKLAMIDTPLQPEEKMLGFVIERSKEWLFNQARTISESIPAHYRSQLANAGGGQAFDDTTSNTTYCFRHKEEYMWTEMEKLLKFAWRHGSVHDIVTSHIATFGAYKTVPGHASRLLTYLMYEESGTTWEHTLLFEYVLVRMFRKNSDGKLYIVKSQSSSKMAACVLSLCRAAVCTFLALSGNYIVPMAEWLLPLVRRGYFTNMVCPLIRKMRDLDNNKCSTSLTTFAPDGSVFHKDLEFKHEVWKRLIPKTTSIIEDCIKKIVDPESKLLKIMDAKKVSVSLTSWTDFEMTTEDSNIVTNKDIILKEDFEFLAYDKLHAAFELVFAGMGAGSARLADVSHTKDYQGKLHMGSVYYFTATNKVGNQRQHTTQKKFIKHKLCKEHSVLFLIYKAVVLELYKRRPFEFINGAEDSLLPKREGNVFGMCDMVCELFNFTRTPTSQEVRQFFTSLVDIIFPSGDTDARVAAKADAADLCSHSLTTHRRNYQTQLVGGEEVMFEIWHEQLGARPSELLLTTQDKVYSVGDLKKYLMQLHGHDAKWTCREQEQLVNLVCNPNGKHTLAVLSCGMGKSIAWMFLCLISRKMNVVVAPYKFLAGYLSSSLLDKLKSKKGVKVVAFTGREINESQLPSELEGEDLPQVLFVTLEAISNLITYHSQEVKNWKDSGNLGHFFIDEIHTLITEFEFREVYDSLKNLSQFGVPVTALTGTLPVQAATGLCRALNLSSDNNSNDCNHIRSNFLIGKFPAGFKFDVMIFENQDQLTEKTVQIANSPLLEVEPGLEPRAIHIICDTKSNAAAIYQLFKKKATCEMVTSSNTYEEQESICAKWREGTTRVLVSTTCALVGNENRLCQHVIIVGWPYNVMNLVQAMGRLRPLQRTEKGSITILLNKIVPVERNPKWKLNEAALHRVLESGLLRNQGEYEDICTVRGLYKWATNKTDCRIKTLSQMFGYTEDVCGVCDTCRSTSVARISNTRTVQNNQRVVTNNRAYCIFKMVEHRCVICTSSECIGMCYKYSQCCKCGSNDHQAGWCPYKTEIKNALQGRGCFTCYDNRNRKGYERHEARGKCPTKERLKRILNYGFEHSDEIDYVKYLSLAFKNVDSYCTHVVDIFDKRKGQ